MRGALRSQPPIPFPSHPRTCPTHPLGTCRYSASSMRTTTGTQKSRRQSTSCLRSKTNSPKCRSCKMPSAVASTSICTPHLHHDIGVPDAYLEPRWYALSTFSNREKVVAEQLRGRAVDHFLPLYNSLRRWKDRRVQLQLPLFAGY